MAFIQLFIVSAEEAWSLEDTLATLTARFHKKVLLDLYVWTDDRDSRRHIIYVRGLCCDNLVHYTVHQHCHK